MALLAFCSGCDTALTGIRRLQAYRALTTDDEAVHDLDVTVGYYHSSLVVTRLFSLIGLVSMATLLAVAVMGLRWWAILAAGLSSAFLTVLAEAPMRPLAAKKPETFLDRVAVPLAILSGITRPLTRLVPMSSEAPFVQTEPEEKEDESPVADAEEFKQLVTDLDEAPEILEDERRLIEGVLGLKETAVKEIVVPRPDITAINVEATLDDVIDVMIESGRSRIRVYEQSLDNVVGVLYTQDVLRHFRNPTQQVTVRHLARQPFFVPENKNVYELLGEFRENGVHLALVIDEYGGVEGLVTLNDVLEEIVGELAGEVDPHGQAVRIVAEGDAVVDASASLEEVNEALGVELEGKRIDTIGGYVLHHLGHMPKPGERVDAGEVSAEVISTAGRRIKKLRLKKLVREEPVTRSS